MLHRMIIVSTLAILALTSSNLVNGQIQTFDSVVLKKGLTNFDDVFLQFLANEDDNDEFQSSLFIDATNKRYIQQHDGVNYMVVEEGTNAFSFWLNDNGIAINHQNPSELLHLRSNGSIYDRAQIYVENAHDTAEKRTLLRMKNNGGVKVDLENTDQSHTFSMVTNAAKTFYMQNEAGKKFIQVEDSSNENTVYTTGMGLGIGTDMPERMLHIRNDSSSDFDKASMVIEDTNSTVSDRNMLEFRNKGGTRIRLKNTNTDKSWLMTTDGTDRLSLKVLGAGQPQFELRANGYLAHTVAGQKNLQLFTNGNLKLRGVVLPPSDRDMKENFEEVNSTDILEKISKLSITKWNYKHQDEQVKHVGPVAQDFMAAFNLGDDERAIATVDADGIALAAIKGLYAEKKQKDKEIAELKKQLETQKEIADELLDRMQQLEALVVAAQK